MFTGIIEQKSLILSVDAGNFVMENHFDEPIALGQSIAHDGACMTITDFGDSFQDSGKKRYSFFAMQESLEKTNFGQKKVGDSFNIERCMIYGQRVDGHLVSGHIDTTAIVHEVVTNHDGSFTFSIVVDRKWQDFCIYKGSIAINGVSLTIASIRDESKESRDDDIQKVGNFQSDVGSFLVTVCLIPYTRVHTNLSDCTIGDSVNIEFDMLGKYVLNNIRNT